MANISREYVTIQITYKTGATERISESKDEFEAMKDARDWLDFEIKSNEAKQEKKVD